MVWRNRLEQSVGSFQQQVGVPINEFKSPITRAQMILSRSGQAISCTQRTGNYCMLLTVAFVAEPRVSEEAWQAPASQKILPCVCQQSLPKPAININGPFRRKKTRPLLRSFSALPNKPSSATRSPEVAVSYISFLGSELNPETACVVNFYFWPVLPCGALFSTHIQVLSTQRSRGSLDLRDLSGVSWSTAAVASREV